MPEIKSNVKFLETSRGSLQEEDGQRSGYPVPLHIENFHLNMKIQKWLMHLADNSEYVTFLNMHIYTYNGQSSQSMFLQSKVSQEKQTNPQNNLLAVNAQNAARNYQKTQVGMYAPLYSFTKISNIIQEGQFISNFSENQ